MFKMTAEVWVSKPDSQTFAGELKAQGYRITWDGSQLVLTRGLEISSPLTESRSSKIISGVVSPSHVQTETPVSRILEGPKISLPSTFPVREAYSLEPHWMEKLGLVPQQHVLVRAVSPVERPRSPKLLVFQADLCNSWNDLNPWTAEIPSPPALKSFSLPPNFTKRVARPLAGILDLVAEAKADPTTARRSLYEAHRIQDDLFRRIQSGREWDSIKRGLTDSGKPETLQSLLETGPAIIDALALCHQALEIAGLRSDQLQWGCVKVRAIDRSVCATSDLNALPDLLDTVLGAIGAGLDYERRLRKARALDDNGLRAWATATGDFIAHRALSAGLAALSGYLCVIPGVGPIVGPLVALFSGALASKLLAPMPG